MLFNQTFSFRLSSFAVMPHILVDMYQVRRNLFPKSCYHSPETVVFIFTSVGTFVCPPVMYFFPLHMFLPISSMALMELYCHSPMCLHGEHRDSLYLSALPHGVILYHDVLEAKKSAGSPSTYFLLAPISRMLYLQSQTFCLCYH